MQDKLYFEPEDYGAGKKKKEHKPKEKSEKKEHRFLKLLGFLLFLGLVILIIIWLLRGKTVTTGQYPADLTNEFLECSSSEIEYEKIDPSSPKSKDLKITLVFIGSDKLSTGGLRYRLQYETHDEATRAEAVAHALFSTSLARVGYGFTEFENKFTILDDVLEVSLHASASNIDEYSAEYFMIDATNGLPKTLPEYKENYESQGFKCKTSTDK